MGRSPCCDESAGVKRGPWTPEEDEKLIDYINQNGHTNWSTLPKLAGLNRCGKSCRLRWTNYLRPDIKRGKFSEEEERVIIKLHSVLGNKWSKIAAHLPGRTDNEIKNLWNTHLRKKLLNMGIDPNTHKPRTDFNHLMSVSQLIGMANLGYMMNPWGNSLGLRELDITQIAKIQLLKNYLLQIINANNNLLSANMQNSSMLGQSSLGPCESFSLGKGTSSLNNNNGPLLPSGQEYAIANPVSFPRSNNDYNQDIVSLAGLEGGYKPEFSSVDHNCLIFNPSLHQNETENPQLPPLVSVSPGTLTKQIESSCDPHPTQTQTPTSTTTTTIFEDWEKLMDDETSDSYWREILELTRASEPPISW